MSLLLVSRETARPELVLQAYHVLLSHHRPDARLLLIGPDPGPDVREYARQLGLRGLVFVEEAPVEAADGVALDVVDDSPLVMAEAVLARLSA